MAKKKNNETPSVLVWPNTWLISLQHVIIRKELKWVTKTKIFGLLRRCL